MSNIAAAFVKAQKGFAPALKDKTNPHFKSKYVDLASCVEAVIDSLHANGIALMQRTYTNESGVTVETVFLHESGEMIEGGLLSVPAAKQDPQGYGSALTYARRYSLMAACGIAPEDDDGNAASRPAKVGEPGAVKGVAGAVLATSPAIPERRKTELALLAGNIATAFEKRGAAWCMDRLDEEDLDDVEKIYMSTLLTSAVRNALKAESQARHQATKETA